MSIRTKISTIPPARSLATIKDLLIGPDGKAAAAIINVGRYLGIGDKDIAAPFSALRVERHGDGRQIVIDAAKEDVQAAPTFASARAQSSDLAEFGGQQRVTVCQKTNHALRRRQSFPTKAAKDDAD